MSFIFGVLGSVVFWICFFAVGFFCGTAMMKHIAPKTFRYFTTGERSFCNEFDQNEPWEYIIVAILIILFWPLILGFLAIILAIKLIFGKIMWSLFRGAIVSIAKTIPDIEIKKTE